MDKLIKDLLAKKDLSYVDINELKKRYADRHKSKLPLNSTVLEAATPDQRKMLVTFLKTKPTRTISGVSVIAIMTAPEPCPGRCIYCPQGDNAPKSYTGFEPAAMRAQLNHFDPYKQVQNRLWQLNSTGHDTSKNELIIMGGTFPSLPWDEQKEFVKCAFDGFNNKNSMSLQAAQKKNETTEHRIVGLTVETRPDWIFPEKFIELGATRVELGVQSTSDDILKSVHRGNTVGDVSRATSELKDAAFKVLYHIMPGLPGSTFDSDVQMFHTLFADERFKPDMLKIYPTLVIKGTKLYDMWKAGKYKPINESYMIGLLKEIYKISPKWVRIMRVQRDIPAPYIEAGPKKSNIRQMVLRDLKKSSEIRFREAGHAQRMRKVVPKNAEIVVEKYLASGGKEYFISAEDVKQDILLGFCRLRIGKRKEAMIRELHVYGLVTPIGKLGKIQHKGLGSQLLSRAEKLAKKAGKKEILIISGVGVREYYRKLGYQLKDGYMHKEL
ncbi:tRNA uridine(34) 5-carboxymethylaminomethyl modification radical SAM/GNAT enzyme Elp3 [Candidatus Woesearchaeota archaeon]|jgi:elongator complex protein 3|nr:tRNA uridine(34) 5-carboxymethylaminomethyl modification radical SAM/GNAT enzyme Elp3 [Candidatus Woesearchaeota archaeon]MBT4114709.1 tRNA uridine(34) 5-carboxymethylaminomethyl modification radical SAM/GNAT enzyme Elp3 [Candidatus Woesearchaeota archaeon]MBT4248165.1 tRNA uridine(34) 5-carboxymethylaminomethyl modification radical SAM/GNAT enzyme Elp3 [Candidatus Woesearchaeota archaeon]